MPRGCVDPRASCAGRAVARPAQPPGLTNYALSGIPEDKVRYHVCWGSWNAPHTTDPSLRTLSGLILKIKAQAYSLESANPRHEHEWMVWKDV